MRHRSGSSASDSVSQGMKGSQIRSTSDFDMPGQVGGDDGGGGGGDEQERRCGPPAGSGAEVGEAGPQQRARR